MHHGMANIVQLPAGLAVHQLHSRRQIVGCQLIPRPSPVSLPTAVIYIINLSNTWHHDLARFVEDPIQLRAHYRRGWIEGDVAAAPAGAADVGDPDVESGVR